MLQTRLDFTPGAPMKTAPVPCITCKGHRILVVNTVVSFAGTSKEARPFESMHKHFQRHFRN